MVDLSIIIPVYNVESTLLRCVDSVVSSIKEAGRSIQYEIILVEDASTDGSLRLAEMIADKQEHCHLIRHACNRGLAVARETGLRSSKGRYLAWVDSDDTVCGEWFDEIADAILTYDADIIAFDFEKRFSDGRIEGYDYGAKRFAMVESGCVNTGVWVEDVLRSMRTFAFSCTKVFRRHLLSDVGFDAPRGALEDMGAMLSIADRINKVVYIPKRLYHYYINKGSLAGTLDANRRLLHVRYAHPKILRLNLPYRCAASVSVFQLLTANLRDHFLLDNVNEEVIGESSKYMRRMLPWVLLDADINMKIKAVFFMGCFHWCHWMLKWMWTRKTEKAT